MTDLTRKAGDPLGVVVPATVGVTPRTLMIPEAVQVVAWGEDPPRDHATLGNDGRVRLYSYTPRGEQRRWTLLGDITHLWPEKPCAECLQHGPSPHCDCNDGTVRSLPKPGEWWIVGHRPCELLPVEPDDDDGEWDDANPCIVVSDEHDRIHHMTGTLAGDEWIDITSHFPDGLPTTDDLAGVCGELVLADEAVKL